MSCGGDLQPADLPLPLVRCHALFPATVAPFAPPRDEVKAAFRRAALACHPDVDKSPQAAARFTQVKAAADVLLKGVRAFCWLGVAARVQECAGPSTGGMRMLGCCSAVGLLEGGLLPGTLCQLPRLPVFTLASPRTPALAAAHRASRNKRRLDGSGGSSSSSRASDACDRRAPQPHGGAVGGPAGGVRAGLWIWVGAG